MAPEADGYGMRARAHIQPCKEMADVHLDGLLGEKELLTDLASRKALRDQLEYLDLPLRRLPLDSLQLPLQPRAIVADAETQGHFVESTDVIRVTAQYRTACSGVHPTAIGGTKTAV